MQHLTPIKAIRRKCLDCCGGNPKEVRLCPVSACSLYPYRMVKRPGKETGTTNTPANPKSREIALTFLADPNEK